MNEDGFLKQMISVGSDVCKLRHENCALKKAKKKLSNHTTLFFLLDENGDANPKIIGEGDPDLLELLVESLVKVIIELPVCSTTYLLHLEAVNTLIILLSVQMFWSKSACQLAPYK